MLVASPSCFFFQAEDGIRDLVRSRGLGDVYKRQVLSPEVLSLFASYWWPGNVRQLRNEVQRAVALAAVSYTHLTLPTSDLV